MDADEDGPTRDVSQIKRDFALETDDHARRDNASLHRSLGPLLWIFLSRGWSSAKGAGLTSAKGASAIISGEKEVANIPK